MSHTSSLTPNFEVMTPYLALEADPLFAPWGENHPYGPPLVRFEFKDGHEYVVLRRGELFYVRRESDPTWMGAFEDGMGKLIEAADEKKLDWLISMCKSKLSNFNSRHPRVVTLADPREDRSELWRVFVRRFGRQITRFDNLGFAEELVLCSENIIENWNGRDATIKFVTDAASSGWIFPESVVARAFKWADLPRELRQIETIHWLRGTPAEVLNVLKWAIFVESFVESSRELRLMITPQTYLFENEVMLQNSEWQNPDKTSRFVRLEEHVLRHCAAICGSSKREQRLAINSSYLPVFDEMFQQPTAHEKLEAAINLRAWLQEHAPELLSDWFPD